MPAKSLKQKHLMDAAAHNPAFAKKVGIPTSVAKDFSEASKGQKFGNGGSARAAVQNINNPKTNHGANALFTKGGAMATKKPAKMDSEDAKEMAFMKKNKAPASMMKAEKKEMASEGPGFAKGGAMSGKAMEMRHVSAMKKAGVPKNIVAEEQAEANSMKRGGMAKKYAKGGGIEVRGKTAGKLVTMKSGGRCK